MELQEICEKLDETVLDFFDVLGEFYQEQAKLEQYMKDGYINLSRARYSMGVKSVGALQLPEKEMNPLLTVSVPKDKNSKLEFQKTDVKKDTKRSDSDEVRNRKTKVETVGSDENEKADKMEAVIEDPIKWFGVLVPQALRRSQTSFQEAANFAVTVANLKSRLESIRKDYRNLLNKKKELIENE